MELFMFSFISLFKNKNCISNQPIETKDGIIIEDAMLQILDYLPQPDLYKTSRVNKQFYELSHNKALCNPCLDKDTLYRINWICKDLYTHKTEKKEKIVDETATIHSFFTIKTVEPWILIYLQDPYDIYREISYAGKFDFTDQINSQKKKNFRTTVYIIEENICETVTVDPYLKDWERKKSFKTISFKDPILATEDPTGKEKMIMKKVQENLNRRLKKENL